MDVIFGRIDGARVVGGMLLPRESVIGTWRRRDEAFAALAAGLTARVVVPRGGTGRTALVAGPGVDRLDVAPAQIAARIQRAAPDQVRYDAAWLRRALSLEHLRPSAGEVHWVIAAGDVAEAWVPVEVAARRHCDGRRHHRLSCD
jgi:hypothetical protein